MPKTQRNTPVFSSLHAMLKVLCALHSGVQVLVPVFVQKTCLLWCHDGAIFGACFGAKNAPVFAQKPRHGVFEKAALSLSHHQGGEVVRR